MTTSPEATDRLWATYHHIAKLDQAGKDSRGNYWEQGTWGCPASARMHGVDSAQAATPDVFYEADELCGTAMCFAGWYAVLNGKRMSRWGTVEGDSGRPMGVATYTQEDAGLGRDQRHDLFGAGNSLKTIAAELTRITGEDRS